MADTKETKDKSDFTTREMEIMTQAWTCLTVEPQVDYNKLAEACGMTNPRSASNAWSAIKKKIVAKAGIVTGDGEEGGASPAKKTPKSTPRKRGKKAEAEANGDGDDAEETPAKKPKATPRKKGKVKSEPEVEEDGEGEGKGSPVKGEQEE